MRKNEKRARVKNFILQEESIKKIQEMVGNGLTHKQIARGYGTSRSYLDVLRKENENLDLAFRKGKLETLAEVAGILMQHIRGGSLSAAIFYLKTQGGWREKSTLEVKDKVKYKKLDYKLDTVDAIEASKIYQSIMTGSYNDERNSPGK